MAEVKPRAKMPKSAKKGEIIKVKTLLKHKMETGRRIDPKTKKLIPRKIINKFTATFDGELVFYADLEPSVSGNLMIKFEMRATKSGTMQLEWRDDDGTIYTKKMALSVE